MPTKRTRRAHNRMPEISPALLSHISEGLWPMPEGGERELTSWKFLMNAEEKQEIFSQVRDFILENWIQQRPGTRPNFWWKSDAPEKMRRRLGGVGDDKHDYLAYVESYTLGIPSHFVSKFDEEYYNGRALDIHGNKITDEYEDGDFKGRGVDPNDPPVYESQAAYLKRHGLLTPEEAKKLKPADFEPEIVEVVEEDHSEELGDVETEV